MFFFVSIPFLSLYRECIVRFPLPDGVFYLVTTGWISDVSLSEDPINQFNQHINQNTTRPFIGTVLNRGHSAIGLLGPRRPKHLLRAWAGETEKRADPEPGSRGGSQASYGGSLRGVRTA